MDTFKGTVAANEANVKRTTCIMRITCITCITWAVWCGGKSGTCTAYSPFRTLCATTTQIVSYASQTTAQSQGSRVKRKELEQEAAFVLSFVHIGAKSKAHTL